MYLTRISDLILSLATCLSELLRLDPFTRSGQDRWSQADLFDSPCRGHFDPRVQVARRAIVPVSGLRVCSSPAGTQGLETHCRSALSSPPPKFPPSGLYAVSPGSTFYGRRCTSPAGEDTGKPLVTHTSAST